MASCLKLSDRGAFVTKCNRALVLVVTDIFGFFEECTGILFYLHSFYSGLWKYCEMNKKFELDGAYLSFRH